MKPRLRVANTYRRESRGWVCRLPWSDSRRVQDHAEALAHDRPAKAIAGIIDSAEEAVSDALAGHRADRLRGLARQLREVAPTLERAERRG